MEIINKPWTEETCPAATTVVRLLEALRSSDTMAAFVKAWYGADTTKDEEEDLQHDADDRTAMCYEYLRASMVLSVSEEGQELRTLPDEESAERWVEERLRLFKPSHMERIFDERARLVGSGTRTERKRAVLDSLVPLVPEHLVERILEEAGHVL